MAPDMPGHGEDKLPIEDQNLEKYARAVEDLVAPLSKPVILAGHSFAGMITSQAACYISDKIKKLVYISALLPRDCESCVRIIKSIHPTFHEKLVASGQEFILPADGKHVKYSFTKPPYSKRELIPSLLINREQRL